MKKKGFTLVELMAVIILLGVIALIAYPIVTNTINNSKEKAYEETIRQIEQAASKYGIDNTNELPQNESTVKQVSLDQLIRLGYIKKTNNGKLYNPIDNSEMTGCVLIQFDPYYTQYIYAYSETCSGQIVFAPPKLTAKSVAITIGRGKDINLMDSFTITQDGNLQVTKNGCVNKSNNQPIDTTLNLTEGEYNIICTATNEKNLIGSGEIKIRVVDSKWKCVRAEAGTLHQEVCNQTSDKYNCSGVGYATGATIEYGKIKELGTDLSSGDALNCDLNGDMIYDPITERFYYVSSLYDTTNKTFNDQYAALIYYTNTLNGLASKEGAAYYSTRENWHGPITAATHLPTVNQWTNVSLSNTSRQLLNQSDGNKTGGGTLGTFSYINSEGVAYAARLLTFQEAKKACGDEDSSSHGYLRTKCEYLMENTNYSTRGEPTYGPWLETPASGYVGYSKAVYSSDMHITNCATEMTARGVRPAIEVKYTDILY